MDLEHPRLRTRFSHTACDTRTDLLTHTGVSTTQHYRYLTAGSAPLCVPRFRCYCIGDNIASAKRHLSSQRKGAQRRRVLARGLLVSVLEQGRKRILTAGPRAAALGGRLLLACNHGAQDGAGPREARRRRSRQLCK
jgi:hypothetical protein